MNGKNRDCVRTGGFTLVELMIVITIIGILVGLVISFGARFQQMARADRTRMAMKIAMNAADYYFEATNTWPGSGGPNFGQMQSPSPWDPATGATASPTPTNFLHADRLIRDLLRIKGSRERLKNMPSGTLKEATLPREQYDGYTETNWGTPSAPPNRSISQQQAFKATTVIDGWDRPMLFRATMSSQSKPILISGGPDGRFAPTYYYFRNWAGSIGWKTSRETDTTFGLDDITSDQGL